MEITVSCGTCPFFVPSPIAHEMGLCYEGPGQVVWMPNQLKGGIDTRTLLPPKKDSDWCGRHPMFGLRDKKATPNLPSPSDASQPEPRILESEP